MRLILTVGWVILLLSVRPVTTLFAQINDDYEDLSPYVYRITSSNCAYGNERNISTGAKIDVNKTSGIVTALHGVVGCLSISAQNSEEALIGLRIEYVDISRDVAFLVCDGERKPNDCSQLDSLAGGLKISPDDHGDIKVIGYPLGVNYQLSHDQQFHENKIVSLERLLLPGEVYDALAYRKSPSSEIEVYSLRGVLTPGYSGAPIVNSKDEIIAIALGGLERGLPEINWAIPVININWKSASEDSTLIELGRISKLSPSNLFNGKLDSPRICSGIFSEIFSSQIKNDKVTHKFDLDGDNIYLQIDTIGRRRHQPVSIRAWGMGFEYEGPLSIDGSILSYITKDGYQYKFVLHDVKISDKRDTDSNIKFKIERTDCPKE